MSFSVAEAASAYVQGGRRTGFSASNDGTKAGIKPHSFSPSSGDCIIFGLVATNSSSNPQIEAGYVRCNGGPGLDGMCDDVMFVETITSAGFQCYVHGGFSQGVAHRFRLERPYNGSPTEIAYVADDIATESVGGLGGELIHWAWGEATPNNTCTNGWGGSATFRNWQKLTYGSGYTDISGSAYNNCWTVGSPNANKEWNVSH